jgi:hypothetical protein
MSGHESSDAAGGVIATIENSRNPEQSVDVVYVREDNAFVTSGIKACFAEKELLIPAHMVLSDFNLMGAIISAILEKLSKACESESSFHYEPSFEVLDRSYTLKEQGEYMRLEEVLGREGLEP